MSMDLNREQKRTLKRMGAVNDQGAPTRAQRQAPSKPHDEKRVGLFQYLREVREELRKVAWPKWPEVKRYSIIVGATVLVFTAYIGVLDAAFTLFAGWLYKD